MLPIIPDQVIVEQFRPLQLCIRDIGPFRESMYKVDFTNSTGESCNLFLLLSLNGRGKTTILRTCFHLMHALMPPEERSRMEGAQSFSPEGRAQLDLLVRLKVNDQLSSFVLSLTTGRVLGRSALAVWAEDDLARLEVTAWHTIDISENHSQFTRTADEPSKHALYCLRSAIGWMNQDEQLSVAFMEPMDNLPSVVWLPTHRHIDAINHQRPITQPAFWGYNLAYDVSSDSGGWDQSLDNLLVWMKWLDDGSLERAIKLVNDYLFEGTPKFLEGVRKSPPEAIVNNGGSRHRLDQLSSGEQSVVQILLRIGAHMTQNSIILIDELELHLHPNWQHKLLNILKQLVRDHPGVTVIASSHSREILSAFPLDIIEEGIRKGGDIVQGGFD